MFYEVAIKDKTISSIKMAKTTNTHVTLWVFDISLAMLFYYIISHTTLTKPRIICYVVSHDGFNPSTRSIDLI